MSSDPLKDMKMAAELDLDVGQPLPEKEQRQPWEQRLDESGSHYKAFKAYRDLEPHKRKISALIGQGSVSEHSGYEWARKFDWIVRARAWDAMKERQRAAGVKAAIGRIAALETIALEQATELYTRNWVRLNEMSKENDKFVLMPAELAVVTDLMIKLARLTRGESTESSEVAISDARIKLDAVIRRYEKPVEPK